MWPGGAPGFESKKDMPEEAKDWWVKNVNNPSLTVFPAPKEKATGAAVIIYTGGGHNKLVVTSEGWDAARPTTTIYSTLNRVSYLFIRDTPLWRQK